MRDIFDEIQVKLDEIEQRENVRILLAVESGSRAWGLSSPDSDYDVRFVYQRVRKDYLRLDEKKDTIDWQLDEVLDINGWDLKKALRQFYKGNATLFEWSNSPVVYRKRPEWDEIYREAKVYFSKKAAVHHYRGTAANTFYGHLQTDRVKYKKYFYALRPLLACRYIEENHCPPPVLFDELMKLKLPEGLCTQVEELLRIKKTTKEGQLNPQLPLVIDFIASELERQKEIADLMEDDHLKDWDVLNRIFMDRVLGLQSLCMEE
ncbi:nucleotidyltransferase domain-containing protein [Sporofaciens musculi]|uniref:nucleotidyltransferase domain-containing protein n=1 Tax=Sporofaciens musculi TaxID=2681861 RepID=UPI002174297B|nr:nucleotidyltransferase domain-containing protein [Sporofaciens musculi]MCI9421925.1 nucleotidyltransferase domain-containing protein [Dorea sp.]